MPKDTDIPVTVTVHIPPAMIADAISTALEAGYASWLEDVLQCPAITLTDDERREHANWYSTPRSWTPGAGRRVTFIEITDEAVDVDGDTAPGTAHEIDVDRIGERLQAMAVKDPQRFARFLASDDEPLDGLAADAFLQLLVLGEVRYG